MPEVYRFPNLGSATSTLAAGAALAGFALTSALGRHHSIGGEVQAMFHFPLSAILETLRGAQFWQFALPIALLTFTTGILGIENDGSPKRESATSVGAILTVLALGLTALDPDVVALNASHTA